MRTPVVLICGQADTADVSDVLAATPGTVVVRHRYDGQVVIRTVHSVHGISEWPLELVKGCLTCTVRNDLLILLRRLHARGDVRRIVVQLMPWLESEPVCWAIDNVGVRVGPGYPDGPAGRDVQIAGVVTSIDADRWVEQAVGDQELTDGRTVAQVVVSQAAFADVVVVDQPRPELMAILRRLAPLAHLMVQSARIESVLAAVGPHHRRGRRDEHYEPLLAGEPPLHAEDDVALVLFCARRPFHPARLHDALDVLLHHVVRTRGRLWLANRLDDVMWLESAGGGLHFEYAGKWLAAMGADELDAVDLQRRALAAADWDDELGDRQVSMTVLTCGAPPEVITDALHAALLTDDEMGRRAEWADYPDPFGDWHDEPCAATPEHTVESPSTHQGDDR